MERKVVRLLNELPAKEERDKDAMLKLRDRILTNDRKVNERIDKIVEENFTLPDTLPDIKIASPDEKGDKRKDDKSKDANLSFRDYMTSNLTSLAESVKALESSLAADYVLKGSYQSDID